MSTPPVKRSTVALPLAVLAILLIGAPVPFTDRGGVAGAAPPRTVPAVAPDAGHLSATPSAFATVPVPAAAIPSSRALPRLPGCGCSHHPAARQPPGVPTRRR